MEGKFKYKCHLGKPTIVHWAELGHMATSNFKGDWEMQSFYVPKRQRKESLVNTP